MQLHMKEERRLRVLGVDITNEKFLEDYQGLRKDHLDIVGQGAMCDAILLLLSERWRKGEYSSPGASAPPKEVAKKTTKKTPKKEAVAAST